MARTKTITDEQILNAARAMFREHGFSATTSQIAEKAGISEGSIFRRFPSKQDLMVCALGISKPRWIDLADELGSDDRPVEEQLFDLVTAMLEFFVENMPKMTAMMAAGVDMREKLLRSPDAPPIRGLKALANYFAQLRAARRIRMADPEILARMLIATTHHYAFAEFAGINEVLPMPSEMYVRGVVDNLLRAIGPINE